VLPAGEIARRLRKYHGIYRSLFLRPPAWHLRIVVRQSGRMMAFSHPAIVTALETGSIALD
jgi:hypothetical protein